MASPRSSPAEFVPSAPCPKCKNDKAPKRPRFTWWGGVVGPKLLHHAVCSKCGTGFNAKTGKPNLGPIIVYSVVVAAIVITLIVAIGI
jgi:hypothetical protein